MANDFRLMSDEVKPRERILAAGSATTLASYELLAVLLKTGAPGCDVLMLSKRLLSAFGSVDSMVKCDLLSLQETVAQWNKKHPDKEIVGLGPAKMAEMLAAFELVRRGCNCVRRDKVDTLDDVVGMLLQVLGTFTEQEHFLVVPLDTDNKVMRPPECLTKGLKSTAIADPREVFVRALKWGAASVIVAHNHPDGDIKPSDEDVEMTKRLADAGRLLGVDLIDHLIFNSRGEFISMVEEGVLEE